MKHLISILLIFSLTAVKTVKAANTDDQFQQFIDIYNTGDSVAYTNYYLTLSADPSHVAANVKQTLSEYSFSGKVKFMKANVKSASETELVLRNDAFGCWFNVYWINDTAGKYKEHHMRPTRLTTDFLQTGQLTQQQILKKADEYILSLTKQMVFAGNVFIAQNGKQLYNKSFGNNAQGKPNSPDQKFDLASMGKLFTTVSILQLADRGKLTLSDSIGKLLPQIKNTTVKSITINQLLTHTSGMGDFFEDPAFDPFNGKPITKADFVPVIENSKLHFNPGQGFRYSNTGFLLLGLVVESLSGQDLKTYVAQNIFRPAGMTNTAANDGAGGGSSTVTDLYKFSRAIANHKLMGKATTNNFLNFHQGEWGLGQEYQQLGSETITGHSGGFINVCTELNNYKNRGYTVIILSNTEPPFGHFISDKLKELIVRK